MSVSDVIIMNRGGRLTAYYVDSFGFTELPVGLNDAMKLAKGEIIIVFDADYRPARNMLKQIALGFEDPQVGAVMGRVIPYNTNTNMLTRLINLERSAVPASYSRRDRSSYADFSFFLVLTVRDVRRHACWRSLLPYRC